MAKSTSSIRQERAASDTSKKGFITPIMLQMHASECGAACLGIILSYFGRWVPLTELREKCEVSRDGSSAASVSRAARHYGMECKGLGLPVDQLKLLDMPLVVFWQFSHFVVLERFDGDNVYLNDPASGRRTVCAEEFEKNYSGIALRIRPGDQFKPGGHPPNLFIQLSGLLSGTWGALTGILACGFMLTLLTLLIPTALRIYIDEVVQVHSLWTGLVAALIFGGVLVYILSLLKHRFLKRLEVKLSVSGYSEGMLRLLRLPVEFFEHRLKGDLTTRVSSIDRVSKILTNQFLVLIVDVAMSSVLVIAMFAYDLVLSAVVLMLVVLHGVIAHYFYKRCKIRIQTMKREQGLLIGLGMQMLSHADNLRQTGADDRFFSAWSGYQARELHARNRSSQLSAVSASLPGMFEMFRSAAVCGIGGSMVIGGTMTLGTFIGFFILSQIFMDSAGRFFKFADTRQEVETDLQRLDDISRNAEDPVFVRRNTSSKSVSTFKGRLQLTGHLELKEVTFGFNKSRPPIIKDFSLDIKPGQRVAVIGPSGSGKSTLTRLILGLYHPWSGEILFDGHPRSEIPEEVIRQSISMVDQEIVLFSASLRDNITLWNSAVPDETLFAATRDSQIHNDILMRPQGFSTVVEEGGTNFSGGQRQRLEIARALVDNPTLLVLDEATSSLDAATEADVDAALRRRGVTCLIVAHRLSTVRDCDEIIVLEKGTTVQRGTHDELLNDRDGLYYKLVKSG